MQVEFSTRDRFEGCPVPLGAASARYLNALGLDEREATELVRKAEPVRLRLIELNPAVAGRSGTTTIVEAIALARGKAPHEVTREVREHLPRGREAIGDVLLLERARQSLPAEAS